jgi:hypothetical protein
MLFDLAETPFFTSTFAATEILPGIGRMSFGEMAIVTISSIEMKTDALMTRIRNRNYAVYVKETSRSGLLVPLTISRKTASCTTKGAKKRQQCQLSFTELVILSGQGAHRRLLHFLTIDLILFS